MDGKLSSGTTVDPDQYDVIIIGGGMIGSSLALALGPLGLRIAMIERFSTKSDSQPSFDDRTVALAYGTRTIFNSMGLWERLQQDVMPITSIHISDRGHFGATRLHNRESGVEALGYVIENRVLGKALQQSLDNHKNLTLYRPAEVMSVYIEESHANVAIAIDDKHQTLTAKLVVAADGSESAVRDQLQMETRIHDYGQTAIVANVSVDSGVNTVAYERFTDCGPIALLPMRPLTGTTGSVARYSLVWTVQNDNLAEHIGLSDDEFLHRLQERFGHRVGKFTRVGRRNSYPLKLLKVPSHIQSRVALIGNAAHTLHPVAGQGYNLGMRDVAFLAETIAAALHSGKDIGDLQVLEEYASFRQRDHQSITTLTDGLVKIFTNPLLPVKLLRSTALTLLDFVAPLKNSLAKRTMGMAGRIPQMAKGRSLK